MKSHYLIALSGLRIATPMVVKLLSASSELLYSWFNYIQIFSSALFSLFRFLSVNIYMFNTTYFVVPIRSMKIGFCLILIAQMFFEIILSCFCKSCMLVIIENALPVLQEYYHLNFLQLNQQILNLKIDAHSICLFNPS